MEWKWSVKRDTTVTTKAIQDSLKGIIKIDPATRSITVQDSQTFVLKLESIQPETLLVYRDTTAYVLPKKDILSYIDGIRMSPKISPSDSIIYQSEEGKWAKMIGYSIVPGGGRFQKGHRWQGVALGMLQVGPIPFAIYYNDQYRKYLQKARDAAFLRDEDALDQNFDKAQDFRSRAGIMIGISTGTYLLNIVDVFIIKNKEVKYQTVIDDNGIRFNISKKF